jgi:digeranylgeranylglycerophospholipid reductase
MAARVLAGGGRKILVLERRKEVGVPVQCGEGLSETAFDDYELPKDAPWVAKKVRGAKIITPNGKEVIFPRTGFCIRRDGLDQWLIEKAQERGADLKKETAVRKMTRTGMDWEVITSKGTYKSTIVVIAAGANYRIDGIEGPRSKARNIIAYEYKFNSEDRFRDDYLWCYHSEDYQPGYLWIFERGTEVSVGIGGDGRAKKILNDFCFEQDLDIQNRTSTHAGYIPDSSPVPVFVKDGLLWSGDAAGTVHPLTKGGIHGALYSGKAAGETILKAISEKDLRTLFHYQKQMERFPLTDWKLWKKNEAWMDLSNKTLDLAGNLLDGNNYDEIPIWAAIKSVIKDPTALSGLLRILSIQKAYKKSEKFAW